MIFNLTSNTCINGNLNETEKSSVTCGSVIGRFQCTLKWILKGKLGGQHLTLVTKVWDVRWVIENEPSGALKPTSVYPVSVIWSAVGHFSSKVRPTHNKQVSFVAALSISLSKYW